jgi:predicted metal-dependent hydrolase
MSSVITWPPPYKIRRSQRARLIRLNITPTEGLVIVVPWRVSKFQAIEFLYNRRSWVEKHLSLLNVSDQFIQEDKIQLPDKIELGALSQRWQVRYEYQPETKKVNIFYQEDHVILSGNINEPTLCFHRLGSWVKETAKIHLTKLMHSISQETELRFSDITFRTQKTLWGSCSKNNNISLNYKLLFLPYEVVRYVLIHELCHTVHFNHSRRFWNLLAKFEPNYKALRKELRLADKYVPKWFYVFKP